MGTVCSPSELIHLWVESTQMQRLVHMTRPVRTENAPSIEPGLIVLHTSSPHPQVRALNYPFSSNNAQSKFKTHTKVLSSRAGFRFKFQESIRLRFLSFRIDFFPIFSDSIRFDPMVNVIKNEKCI